MITIEPKEIDKIINATRMHLMELAVTADDYPVAIAKELLYSSIISKVSRYMLDQYDYEVGTLTEQIDKLLNNHFNTGMEV